MPDTPRARALGKELRAARQASGLTMRRLGELIGCSEAKVSRLETARRRPSPRNVAAYLDALRIRGAERQRLLRMAEDLDRPAWWESGTGLPAQLTELADAESRAVRITEVAEVLIPGLLQLPEYSRALFAATDVPQDRVERLVAARLARQAVLSGPEPVEYEVLLDEAALCRAVGGPAAMAAQLRAVVQSAAARNVDVRVVPFAAGAHTGLDGPFLLLEFADQRPLVHVEQRRCGAFLDDPDDVAPFRRARSTLCRTAMGPAESAALITAYATAYEREEATRSGPGPLLAEVELQR